MTEQDRERFDRLMSTLAEVYGEASILKRQAYWMALQKHAWEDVEFAAIRCLETRQSHDGYPAPWPTPADLIALMWNDQDAVPDTQPVPNRKALPTPRPDPEMQNRIKAMAGELAQRFAEPFLPQGTVGPVRFHATRLIARGLEESAAYQQAVAMVADPNHIPNCEVCRTGSVPQEQPTP